MRSKCGRYATLITRSAASPKPGTVSSNVYDRQRTKKSSDVNKRCWIGCINTMSRGQTVSTISLVGDGRPNSMEPKKKIIDAVKQDKPQDHQLPSYGWTSKKLRHWVAEKLQHRVSCTTLRSLLKQAGLS